MREGPKCGARGAGQVSQKKKKNLAKGKRSVPKKTGKAPRTLSKRIRLHSFYFIFSRSAMLGVKKEEMGGCALRNVHASTAGRAVPLRGQLPAVKPQILLNRRWASQSPSGHPLPLSRLSSHILGQVRQIVICKVCDHVTGPFSPYRLFNRTGTFAATFYIRG